VEGRLTAFAPSLAGKPESARALSRALLDTLSGAAVWLEPYGLVKPAAYAAMGRRLESSIKLGGTDPSGPIQQRREFRRVLVLRHEPGQGRILFRRPDGNKFRRSRPVGSAPGGRLARASCGRSTRGRSNDRW